MMLSPPRHISTRSGLIAGKKRTISPKTVREDNNNHTPPKTTKKQIARTPTKTQNKTTSREDAKAFSIWFQQMLDNDRHNFTLYLADEVILEWFGRTVKTRKKVSGFLQFDMQCSRHHFLSVVGCPPFTARVEKSKRNIPDSPETELATHLDIPETPTTKLKSSLNRLTVRGSSLKKRPGLRSDSVSPDKRIVSPQWENSSLKHGLDDEAASDKKRVKSSHAESMDVSDDSGRGTDTKRPFCRKLRFNEGENDTAHRGDTDKTHKFPLTPLKQEIGQGDCLPSTSAVTDARSLLMNNLPRKYIECNGFIEFNRSKNKRCVDTMKWERKCTVRICYSDDPVNMGEYTIWTMIYTDDIKCKRNLLAAFEEVAQAEDKKKTSLTISP